MLEEENQESRNRNTKSINKNKWGEQERSQWTGKMRLSRGHCGIKAEETYPVFTWFWRNMEGEKNGKGVVIKLALWGKKGIRQLLELDIIKTGFIIKLKKGKISNFIYMSNLIAS